MSLLPSDQGSVLSKTTLMPVGMVLTLVIALSVGWGYFNTQFSAIMVALEKQDRRLEKLEDRDNLAWSTTDQKLWGAELRFLNPDLKLKIPE